MQIYSLVEKRGKDMWPAVSHSRREQGQGHVACCVPQQEGTRARTCGLLCPTAGGNKGKGKG